MTQESHHHIEHTHSDLIQQLTNCAFICEGCASACLEENDVTILAHCIELDRDCAELCIQAAKLLQRDSEIGLKFLIICEEICRLCAEECSKHDHDHCRKCASTCLKCAESCHAHHGSVHLK